MSTECLRSKSVMEMITTSQKGFKEKREAPSWGQLLVPITDPQQGRKTVNSPRLTEGMPGTTRERPLSEVGEQAEAGAEA